MAGKQIAGDGLPANIAGMSKNQLYEIMSQMKSLIEQNQQQARQILIQNPLLTKALFQAQIMLGMVRPPQSMPNIQPVMSQHSQQLVQPTQQSNTQVAPSLPGLGVQDQPGPSQMQAPARKQYQNQPTMPSSSAAPPAFNLQSQPMSSYPLQTQQQPKGHLNPQMTPASLPQSSQLPNPPAHPHHSSQPPQLHQPQMSSYNQLQQPLQTSGGHHMPLQPPLPPQPRPSMSNFHHQYPPQMGPNSGYQHPSQSMFHSGTKPPTSVGPSFPLGQPPLPNHPPPQSMYQGGGMHLGSEYSHQVGTSMQADRGTWMSGPPESSSVPQLSGPPSLVPGQMPGSQPARGTSLSPEEEKALLQQVMILTPEQINLLPPEQKKQVLQLQQIMRQ
ncbi:PREDICTED: cleavage stimulating factor 64 [Fragaria vesca subsp. vesca]|uniref:cleavage stimulating factor 64 n=1 Tax=Fragaria vesca subsp. vesca TaxID=101020 RepID=UPI0002C31F99|nr:PREDICTED: cleavage stimulating factor 64 [Fragaria vesca subsp. vesca]